MTKLTYCDPLTLYLSNLGFQERELSWCRVLGICIQIVELQFRSDQKAIAFNTGVHYTFLPIPKNSSESECDLTRIKVATDCEFYKRIVVREKEDLWVEIAEAKRNPELLLKIVRDHGMIFFSSFEDLKSLLDGVTQANIDNIDVATRFPTTRVRRFLFLARAHKYLGEENQARSWAQFGLNNLGAAKDLRRQFQRFLE